MKTLLFTLIILAITSCDSTYVENHQDKFKVNFQEMKEFAHFSEMVYEKESEIKKSFSSKGEIKTGLGKKYQLQWFTLKENLPSQTIWIAIRGTANLKNAMDDIHYAKKKDKLTGLWLHKGFAESTAEIYDAVKQNLSKNKEIKISGHSLGGAAAAIMMLWLQKEGYRVSKCYTFGQPKVTNQNGAQENNNTPLIRVIDKEDPVPYMPPATIISDIHGHYSHFGPEVIMKSNSEYTYLTSHDASRIDISSLWNKLGDLKLSDHFIKNYIKTINSEIKNSNQVSYQHKDD